MPTEPAQGLAPAPSRGKVRRAAVEEPYESALAATSIYGARTK